MKRSTRLVPLCIATLATGCVTVNLEVTTSRCRWTGPGADGDVADGGPSTASAEGCTAPALLDLASIPPSPSLANSSENVLAVFEVDGDDLVAGFYRQESAATGALGLWREIVLRIPTNQRLDLVQFQIYERGPAGYVDNGATGSLTGRYGSTLALHRSNIQSNPADPCAPLSRRRGNFDWTLIHEFGHLRGYVDGAIHEYTRAFSPKTGPGEGYPEDGSPRLDGHWVTSYAERAGGDEDFAESFTAYVMLDALPTENSMAANKVRWFDTFPGYPELRRALRVTEPDGSTAAIRPAPRREFPLRIEPRSWMVGNWRGSTEDGVEVEYRITSDDVVRIRFENGSETERLRYSALRDGGVLATVDLYEAQDDFYLHQVSIAGANFSESFRPGDGSLLVENERLGDFAVEPVDP